MSDDDKPQNDLQHSPAANVLKQTKKSNRDYISKLSEISKQRKAKDLVESQTDDYKRKQNFQLHISGANVNHSKGPERSVSSTKQAKKWETDQVDLKQYSNVKQKFTYASEQQLEQQNQKINPFSKENQFYAPEALYDPENEPTQDTRNLHDQANCLTLTPNQQPTQQDERTLRSADLLPQHINQSQNIRQVVPGTTEVKTSIISLDQLQNQKGNTLTDLNFLSESLVQAPDSEQPYDFNNIPPEVTQMQINVVDQEIGEAEDNRDSLNVNLVDIAAAENDDGMTPCAIPQSLLNLMNIADQNYDFLEKNFETKKTTMEIYDEEDLITSQINSRSYLPALVQDDKPENNEIANLESVQINIDVDVTGELDVTNFNEAPQIDASIFASLPGNKFDQKDIRQQMQQQLLDQQGGIDNFKVIMSGQLLKKSDEVLVKVDQILNEKSPSPVQIKTCNSPRNPASLKEGSHLVVHQSPINECPDSVLKKQTEEDLEPEIDLPPMSENASMEIQQDCIIMNQKSPSSDKQSSVSRPLSQKERADNLNQSLKLNGIDAQVLFLQIMKLDDQGLKEIAKTLKRLEEGESADIKTVLIESIKLHSTKASRQSPRKVQNTQNVQIAKPPGIPYIPIQNKIDNEERHTSAKRKQQAPLSASRREGSQQRIEKIDPLWSRGGSNRIEPNPALPQSTVKVLESKPPAIIKQPQQLVGQDKHYVFSNVLVIEILSCYQQTGAFNTVLPIVLMNGKQQPYYCLYLNSSDQQQVNLVANSKVTLVDCQPSQLNPIYLIPIQQYNQIMKYSIIQETKKNRAKSLVPNLIRGRIWNIPHFSGIDYKSLIKQFVFDQQYGEAVSNFEFSGNLPLSTTPMEQGIELVFKNKFYQRTFSVGLTMKMTSTKQNLENKTTKTTSTIGNRQTDQLEINILNSYNSDQPGLHAIQFFDELGIEFFVPKQNIKSDQISDCGVLLDSDNIASNEIKYQVLSPSSSLQLTINLQKTQKLAAIRLLNVNNENLADNCAREVEIDFNGDKQKIILNQPFCFEYQADSADFIILKDNIKLIQLLNQNDRLKILEMRLKGTQSNLQISSPTNRIVALQQQQLQSLYSTAQISPTLKKLSDAQLKQLYLIKNQLKISIQIVESFGFTNFIEIGNIFALIGNHSFITPTYIEIQCNDEIIFYLNKENKKPNSKEVVGQSDCEVMLRSSSDINNQLIVVHYYFEDPSIINQYLQNLIINVSGNVQSQLKTIILYVDDKLYSNQLGIQISQMEIDNSFLKDYEKVIEVKDTNSSFEQCIENIDKLIDVPLENIWIKETISNSQQIMDKLTKQLKTNQLFGKFIQVKKDQPIQLQQLQFESKRDKLSIYEYLNQLHQQQLEPPKRSSAQMVLLLQKTGKQAVTYVTRCLQNIQVVQLNITGLRQERFGFNQLVLLNSLKEKINLQNANVFSGLLDESFLIMKGDKSFQINEDNQLMNKGTWFFKMNEYLKSLPSIIMKCFLVFQEQIDLGHISVSTEGIKSIQVIANSQLVFEGVLKETSDLQGICFVRAQKSVGHQIDIVQLD